MSMCGMSDYKEVREPVETDEFLQAGPAVVGRCDHPSLVSSGGSIN